MIRVVVFNAHRHYKIRHAETISMVKRVLRREEIIKAFISIVFINDRRMVQLNKEFLDHRYPTDVLSFPLEETTKSRIEGEVYVNLDQARRQASEYHVSLKNERARLVIHGVLHLAGYRDTDVRDKKKMHTLEDFYMN